MTSDFSRRFLQVQLTLFGSYKMYFLQLLVLIIWSLMAIIRKSSSLWKEFASFQPCVRCCFIGDCLFKVTDVSSHAEFCSSTLLFFLVIILKSTDTLFCRIGFQSPRHTLFMLLAAIRCAPSEYWLLNLTARRAYHSHIGRLFYSVKWRYSRFRECF